MNLTLKNKKLVFRHLSVIFGGGAAIALHAVTNNTAIVHVDVSGALTFLLFLAVLGLTHWGMLAPSGQPKSEHLSERLADAAPSFSGVFILFGGVYFTGNDDASMFLWLMVLLGLAQVGLAIWEMRAVSGQPDSEHLLLTPTPEIEALQARAKAGDVRAASQFAVLMWNARHPSGTRVFYEKSPLEGRIILETVGLAYVLGDEPVVELDHIGTGLLKKIELA